jgi:hypothetical protein
MTLDELRAMERAEAARAAAAEARAARGLARVRGVAGVGGGAYVDGIDAAGLEVGGSVFLVAFRAF